MAKGVLGNDPFRRGAATRGDAEPKTKTSDPEPVDHAAKSKARAERRMDDRLASAPANTELKDPRNRKPKKARAHKHAPEAISEPKANTREDETLTRTAEIQKAAPEPEPKETPLPKDRKASERLQKARKAKRSEAKPSPAPVQAKPVPASPEPLPEPVNERERGPVSTRLPPSPEAEQSPAASEEPNPSPGTETQPGTDTSDPKRVFDETFRTTAKQAARTTAKDALQKATSAMTLAREVATQTLRSDTVGTVARVASGVFSAVMTGLGASGSDEVDTYGKDEKLARQLTPLSDFFYEKYWRVAVEGASHLPEGPSILVANHSGAIPVDGLVLHQALQRERPDLPEARWLAEDQIFHAPFVGTLFNRLGAIRASPENAVRLLEEGRPVITFPEGVHGIQKPFQERYQLKRLGRGGFAKLAVRHQVPIVPVAIVGAEESLPLLGKLPGAALGLPYLPLTVPPLPARWSIRFGEPITVDQIPPTSADDLVEIQKLVERTRDAIEGMLRALLSDRRSVF